MQVVVERGVVGQADGIHWGAHPDGSPVLAIFASGYRVMLAFSVAELKQHALHSAYVAMRAEVEAGAGALRSAPPLVAVDGAPLAVKP